jgi:hypothetical protein
MQFLFADKTTSVRAKLDSSKLPKYYKIPSDIYAIDIKNNEIVIESDNELTIKEEELISKRVASLIHELVNASKGYKDCEMTPAKFLRLLSAFTHSNDSRAINVIFNPNIYHS